MIQKAIRLILLPILFFTGLSAGAAEYKQYLRGNPVPKAVKPLHALILMGGGANQEIAFKTLVSASRGGNVVVLRTTDDPWATDYLYSLGHVNSVETLVIPNRQAANDPFVASRLSSASAIFIAGGDQATYYRNWRGTNITRILDLHLRRGTPLAGTSAGLAILGEFAFMALNDTVGSPETLRNPYDQHVTLTRNFLNIAELRGWITDTHFHIRDRMGRLLAFMARIQKDGGEDQIRGLAVDEDTSVIITPTLKAFVVGSGAAYFLRSVNSSFVCEPFQRLDYSVEVYKLTPRQGIFDFRTQTVLAAESRYNLRAFAGVLLSSKPDHSPY